MPVRRFFEADLDTVTPTDMAEHATAKRRKTRKGTHSCWACKRRKEKCIFGSSTLPLSNQAAICYGCQQRGTPCISQEFPDNSSSLPDGARQRDDRLGRVEVLLEHLINNSRGDKSSHILDGSARHDYAIPTPISLHSEPTRYPQSEGSLVNYTSSSLSCAETPQATADIGDSGAYRSQSTAIVPAGPGKYGRLSQTLYDALPSLENCQIICKASHHSFYMFNELLTISHKKMKKQSLKSPEDILVRPGPNVHPVLIAKYMLQLAHILQQIHPVFGDEMNSLTEPPHVILKRSADTAISLVSTQDRLLGSIEGLECVMLEGLYHANEGSLRLSWAAGRRAMYLAQLMGFHLSESRPQYQKLDPLSNADPRYMWFRIVHWDRSLCLMLGLLQGSNDRSMAADGVLASDMPSERLERMHCLLASRLLERNESYSKSNDPKLTRELDMELQRVARSVPSRWWLVPDLNHAAKDDEDLFWDLKSLITQMFHYNILNQLHLPYLLRAPREQNHEYSKIACVNASREMLSRFVVLRRFNRIAFNCRTADFIALTAAMTLLLAHLDNHCRSSPAGNLLAHQHLSDRAMMEQVQESMEEVSRLNTDGFSTESADLLGRLLAIEAEAADGHMAGVGDVSVQPQKTTEINTDDSDGVVRVQIPYFGVVKIAREGTISKEILKTSRPRSDAHNDRTSLPAMTDFGNVGSIQEPSTQPSVSPSASLSNRRAIHPSSAHHYDAAELPISAQAQSQSGQPLNHHPTTYYNGSLDAAESQPQTGVFDPLLPGLTAGAEDWTFQGIDMAFFDSLMGTLGGDGGIDAFGTAWQTEGR